MERNARRSKRLRKDEDVVEKAEEPEKCEAGLKQRVEELERALASKTREVVKLEGDQRRLEEEKMQLEEEKIQLEEEKIQLEEEKVRLEEGRFFKEEKEKLLEERGQLEEEKRQLEDGKRQLEVDQGKLEVEREQARSFLKELVSLVKCPVCLYLPREDKPVPCCPQGHFVCLTCKDRLVRHQGSLYLVHTKCLSTEVYISSKYFCTNPNYGPAQESRDALSPSNNISAQI